MLTKLRATYENGVFLPVSKVEIMNLPEAAEVEINVETIYENGSEKRAAEFREIAENMCANVFTGNPPLLS